jgi:ribonuclease HI
MFIIYTDGSSSQGHHNSWAGGYAFIILKEDGSTLTEGTGHHEHATNNRMEIVAVLEALKCLPKNSSVVIKTDSQYLIRAFTNKWVERWEKNEWKTCNGKPARNKDLWQQLLPLVKSQNISWEWVKGHSGVYHNEYVDLRAKESRTNGHKSKRKRVN